MSTCEFLRIMNTFNSMAQKHPPFVPAAINTWIVCFTFFVLLMIMSTMHYTNHVEIILIIPFLFSFLSILSLFWKSKRQRKV